MSPKARKAASERLAEPRTKRLRIAPGVGYYTDDGEGHVYASVVALELEEAKAALAAGLVEEPESEA